jgi:hypothetical protein
MICLGRRVAVSMNMNDPDKQVLMDEVFASIASFIE